MLETEVKEEFEGREIETKEKSKPTNVTPAGSP